MALTSEQLEEYKEVLRLEIGDEAFQVMTEQEIYDSAMNLLRLVDVMLGLDGEIEI
jgi:hypothetical protein